MLLMSVKQFLIFKQKKIIIKVIKQVYLVLNLKNVFQKFCLKQTVSDSQ